MTSSAAVVKEDREKVLAELESKLAQLAPRVRIALLLRLGIPAVDVLGVPSCIHHLGWRPLHKDASLRFDGTVIFCMKCMEWKSDR